MQTRSFTPSPKYLTKLNVNTHISMTFFAIMLLPLIFLIGIEGGVDSAKTAAFIIGGILLAGWAFWLVMNRYYYRSLRYEIRANEVIMEVGVLTKLVKHVPFRTITNLTISQDLLDRWYFDLGTLNIQTAGAGASSVAEESLQGLPNVQALYDIIVGELRKFKGSMTPTAADSDLPASPMQQEQLLADLLTEVRAIRQRLEGNG